MSVDREAVEENELRKCFLTIDEFFETWCTQTMGRWDSPRDKRPWGLYLGNNHPRYREIMRELSDGVLAAYIRKKVLVEAGQTQWLE
eukprot:5794858-Karenia_brevis.AAC.1